MLVLVQLACTLPTDLARDTAAGSLPGTVTATAIGDNDAPRVTQIRAESVTNTQAPLPSPTFVPTVQTCRVSTGNANGTVYVRSGPGMQYPVTTVVLEGDVLLKLSESGGWWNVATPELEEGWFWPKWCSHE